jgi:hypothetical protein
VTEIGNGAFARTALTGILIPEGVTKLSTGVFTGCEHLESVSLPATLMTIGRQTFSDCVSLGYISLPEDLEVLEYGTFSGCESLFRVVLPDGLTVIGERAFADCKVLKNMNFPKALSEIGKEAFSGCSALTSVILGNLQNIGDGAFEGCKALSVFAMADCGSLGENIFEGTDVTVYTAMTGRVLAYASAEGIPYVLVRENEPYLVNLPDSFAIEDDYPYHELFALVLSDNTVCALKDYDIDFEKDACGMLTATLTWGDFVHAYPIFISYTETVLTDTDTRGAKYELDSVTKTAMLVSLPEYVKPSKVYVPEKGLVSPVVGSSITASRSIFAVMLSGSEFTK